jgi:hypothetical protein
MVNHAQLRAILARFSFSTKAFSFVFSLGAACLPSQPAAGGRNLRHPLNLLNLR